MPIYRSHVFGAYEVRVAHKMRVPEGTYVGRPTALGNPYRLTQGHTRVEALALYREWLDKSIKDQDRIVCGALERMRQQLLKDKTLTLCCWCYPLDCHADIIAEKLIVAVQGEYVFEASSEVKP